MIPVVRRLLLILGMLWSVQAMAGDRITGKPFATRSEVIARHGMAATSQPLATQAALDILKQGGSAVDAAIAANAVQTVVEPVSCGVGGDLFAMVWDAKTQKLYGLNASGRSPYSLTLDEFKKRSLTHIPSGGPLPVTVPGCVDGWFELHKKFGRLPMATNLAPAIAYAHEGFPLSELIAFYWDRSVPHFEKFPNFKEAYTIDGRAPRKGEVFRRPLFAGTLEKIAKGGRDEFYKGDIAKTIDAFMKREGGFLSARDLAEHTSEWVEPVTTNDRGYDVWELPPNGQGIAVLQMLNILEPYHFTFGTVEHVHTFVEAKKLLLEDSANFYGDSPKVPVRELISKSYAAERRKLIDPHHAARVVTAGNTSETI